MTEDNQLREMEEETSAIRMDDITVSSADTITIPENVREYIGIPERGLIPIRLLLEDESVRFNQPLRSRGQVTIPARIRHKHGIESGDSIDVELVL